MTGPSFASRVSAGTPLLISRYPRAQLELSCDLLISRSPRDQREISAALLPATTTPTTASTPTTAHAAPTPTTAPTTAPTPTKSSGPTALRRRAAAPSADADAWRGYAMRLYAAPQAPRT